MARLTRDHDALVVRLVYDGPPLSGKTTSLRALADGMAREVFSPAEAQGRTLFFDWLEYVGGSFEGIPIHCQIVSVPGQARLAARRRALLAEADAVILVINATAGHLPAARAHLGELRDFLATQDAPRPGVVVQANHRDQPEACSLEALRHELSLDGLAVVESVATENHGIRDVFVLAVRLALDRAREQLKLGSLESGPGATDDPSALLALLKSLEGERLPLPVHAEEPKPPSKEGEGLPRVPRLPDSGAPSGRVWPPIDGRSLLHSARSPGAVPSPAKDGSWWLRQGDWYFHSAPRHEFERLENAKDELLRWAQRHSGGFERLSLQRCIALADTGWGTWRLWQVVRVEESLRHQLKGALKEAPPADAAELLQAAVARLLEARAAFAGTPRLPCHLDLIGALDRQLGYIGLLPPADWNPTADEAAITERALIEREIRPLVEAMRRRWPAQELLAGFDRPEGGSLSAVAEAVAAILAEDPGVNATV